MVKVNTLGKRVLSNHELKCRKKTTHNNIDRNLWANSKGDKLMIFFSFFFFFSFRKQDGFIKCQNLFYGKNRKKIFLIVVCCFFLFFFFFFFLHRVLNISVFMWSDRHACANQSIICRTRRLTGVYIYLSLVAFSRIKMSANELFFYFYIRTSMERLKVPEYLG